jgi:tetratricopeptide (TPR) repeat protein
MPFQHFSYLLSLNELTSGVGYRLYFARRHDQAIAALKTTLELDQNYDLAHIILGYTYAAKGMYSEAVAAFEEGIKRGGDTPSANISLGAAYAHAGEHGSAGHSRAAA